MKESKRINTNRGLLWNCPFASSVWAAGRTVQTPHMNFPCGHTVHGVYFWSVVFCVRAFEYVCTVIANCKYILIYSFTLQVSRYSRYINNCLRTTLMVVSVQMARHYSRLVTMETWPPFYRHIAPLPLVLWIVCHQAQHTLTLTPRMGVVTDIPGMDPVFMAFSLFRRHRFAMVNAEARHIIPGQVRGVCGGLHAAPGPEPLWRAGLVTQDQGADRAGDRWQMTDNVSGDDSRVTWPCPGARVRGGGWRGGDRGRGAGRQHAARRAAPRHQPPHPHCRHPAAAGRRQPGIQVDKYF